MNAARLGRRLREAGGDPERMAEAIVDEVTDPATGLVTRDYLDARLAEFEARIERRFGEFETRSERRFTEFERRFGEVDARFGGVETRFERSLRELTWRIFAMFAVQVALVGLMLRFL